MNLSNSLKNRWSELRSNNQYQIKINKVQNILYKQQVNCLMNIINQIIYFKNRSNLSSNNNSNCKIIVI